MDSVLFDYSGISISQISKGNEIWIEKSGSSRNWGVKLQFLTEWSRLKGNHYRFELMGGSSKLGLEKSGFCCICTVYMYYSAFHKTFDKRFPKFATNLGISFRSCQSNCELRNEVVNFTCSEVGKLISSSCFWLLSCFLCAVIHNFVSNYVMKFPSS